MIKIRNLSFAYPGEDNKVLDHINLDIGENEFIGILGPNGSGKSTLARILNGTLIPVQGSVEVDGYDTRDPKNLSKIRKRVGLLLPSPDNQLITNIVEEDVAFGPENLGLPPDQIRQRVDEALKIVGMDEYARKSPYMLSGGQKQKVGIAGIIAMKPGYMVMDEPTSMLDPDGRREVMQALQRLMEVESLSLIYITHHPEEVIKADRIILLEKGTIKAEGKPAEILGNSQMLSRMGIAPLEITSLIALINKKAETDIHMGIFELDELVEELCHWK
ncbi:MAG: energy-coupling factor transporter ATPase [Syntrophomonadaceae bacterium]|jgi:energy-coupling factor transport system ATP-binding protein